MIIGVIVVIILWACMASASGGSEKNELDEKIVNHTIKRKTKRPIIFNGYSYDNFRTMNKHVELPTKFYRYDVTSTNPSNKVLIKGEKCRFIAQVDDMEDLYLVETEKSYSETSRGTYKWNYRMNGIEEWKYLFSNSTELEGENDD